MKKNVILLVVIFILTFVISFILFNKPKLNIKYNGEEINKTIVLDLDSEFNPFIECTIFDKDISKHVKTSGNVDTSKTGDYSLEYSIKYSIYVIKKKVNVKIVDRIPPEITLTGNNPSSSCSIQTYEEEGYSALDNYDGDISDKVIVRKKDNSVYYSVKDSSENSFNIERKIETSDTEAPKIEIEGEKYIYLKLNEEYSEPGYKITDNCDTEFNDVKIDNNINSSKEGEYIITYTVKDTNGNSSTNNRYVYVYNPSTTNIDGNGVIYLTFDDGPSVYTPKILDILKQYDIKATFFVTNSGKDAYIVREFEEGHTVALHTASHNYKTVYSSVDAYFKDLEKVQNRVLKLTNQKSTIVRFPGGSSNTVSKNYSKGIMTKLSKQLQEKGYHYFDWTLSIEDAGSCAGKKTDDGKRDCIYNNFVKGISKEKANVVLMHDIKYYTAEKLEDMIKYALSQGYKFEKITMYTKEVHHKINN